MKKFILTIMLFGLTVPAFAQNESVVVRASPPVRKSTGPVAVKTEARFNSNSMDIVGQQSGSMILNNSVPIPAPSIRAASSVSFGILDIAPVNSMNCPPKLVQKT